MKSTGFRRMRWALALAVLLPLATNAVGANIVDFEDLDLSVPPAQAYTGVGGGAFWNGSDESGGFTSGDASFLNSYNTEYGSWEGWAYSNTTDTTTVGYTNQYSAPMPAALQRHSVRRVLPVVGVDAHADPALDTTILGAWITNTTYAALSMLYGDPPPNAFAKKFGGASEMIPTGSSSRSPARIRRASPASSISTWPTTGSRTTGSITSSTTGRGSI